MTDDGLNHQRDASRLYDQPATTAERRAILEADARARAECAKPAEPTTFFAKAQADAQLADDRSAVTGSAPMPPLPAPAWCIDAAAVPDEPPLGFDINEVPDLGFPQSQPARSPDDE
jgi:hypothetical protein